MTYRGQTSSRGYRLLELGTLEGILRFVEAGVGIAAMPRAFASSLGRPRRMRTCPLPRELRRLETYLVASATATASRVTNEFVASFG